MKKTLLAAALMAGFAGIAHAETSVTLYGIVDGGVGYNKFKGTTAYDSNAALRGNQISSKKTGLINGVQSGNRWGLKGSEDLGDGLRAVFQLESGFDLGTGDSMQARGTTTRLFGRQATLGLAGDSWGQLDFGRQTNIASKYMPGIVDPFGGGFDQSNAGAAFTSINTVRYDNLITYQTPNFSGFQLGVGYSFNTNGPQAYKDADGVEKNQRAITTGLRYANGPIGLVATYDQRKTAEALVGGNIVGGETVKAWNVGASYDFEVVKASLGFGQTRDGLFSPQSFSGVTLGNNINGKGLKVNSYVVGLSAPVGAGNVMASWTMADPRSAPDAFQNTNSEMKKQNVYSLGYTHPISKRTNVYAIGSYAKNVHFLPDAKSTLVGVGLRHQF